MPTLPEYLLLLFCVLPVACTVPASPGADSARAVDPYNARYQLENRQVQLHEGRAEREIVPGAASREVTTLFGEPVYGDLDGDGGEDAAVLLLRQSGGSGSFFYAAAALNRDEGPTGSNAILLGDRIAPLQIAIRARQIVLLYADRRPGEALALAPTRVKTKYLQLAAARLQESPAADWAGRTRSGWLIIGHEVRSFMPCEGGGEHWLAGSSPALAELRVTYDAVMKGVAPYTPLYALLDGTEVPPAEDGFAADYAAAFRAERLHEADPQGACQSPLIELESPVPGAAVTAAIDVSGRARGNWYFEGDFPLRLVDGRGETLARGFATARGPWMTSDWVPFSGTLDIADVRGKGLRWLVLQKDNPSDNRALDDALVVPVNLP